MELKLPLSKEQIRSLHAGDVVTLTGTIYTARDAAHKKLCAMLAEKGEKETFRYIRTELRKQKDY